MGIIEDSIFTIYKKALEEGNMDQAEKAVELMQNLREKVEIHGFQDYSLKDDMTISVGSFYNPFPYRFYEEESIVVLEKTAIRLTPLECKLFKLFTDNETSGIEVKPVAYKKIKEHLWEGKDVSSTALRLAIIRLRQKIELNPKYPQIIINFYKRGYLFLGKRVTE
jgi:DNA-binding response OmpR family regulator